MQTRNTLPQDNLYYSVLITFEDKKSYGSAFRLKYKNSNYLVTARHVIFDEHNQLIGKKIKITCQNITNVDDPAIFEIDLESAFCKYDKLNDIAIIKLGEFKNILPYNTDLKHDTTDYKRPSILSAENYVKEVYIPDNLQLVSLDVDATRGIDEIRIGNDVFLMGYPTSLGIQKNDDFDILKPLLRKGIIAGINKIKNTIIVDCPTYFGNSGGPIIEYGEDDYYRIIGIVSKYIPLVTKWYSDRDRIVNTEFANSGYTVCVPVQKVFDLIDKI